MEPCRDRVGQREGKMGRLPEAGAISKSDRPEELVIPGILHDELNDGHFRVLWTDFRRLTGKQLSSSPQRLGIPLTVSLEIATVDVQGRLHRFAAAALADQRGGRGYDGEASVTWRSAVGLEGLFFPDFRMDWLHLIGSLTQSVSPAF